MALRAARHLLEMHPDAGGFVLAPGAHAATELDIMSNVPGSVGAETFAVVDPRNNAKLSLDLRKLSTRTEQHRYIFCRCLGEGPRVHHPGDDKRPKDRHVLAAAVVSGAQTIVTFNVKHFSIEALATWNVEVQSPDEFLIHQYHLDPETAS